jgi:hypothetical protein
MSINKIYLPDVEKLGLFLKEMGSTRFFIRYVRNKEAFIGPNSSMNFIDNFCKKYEQDRTTEFTELT